VKKLNTHEFYRLATTINPLTSIEDNSDKPLGDILWTMFSANVALNLHVGKKSNFSSSLKRSAGALMRTMYTIGLPSTVADTFNADQTKIIPAWQLSNLKQAAADFETVLANELPGLATYIVSQKGIYSTDDLISNADQHFPDETLKEIPENARKDICEGGRCLAFELATASAFHMWRALETVMGKYYAALKGKTFEDDQIQRNWYEYIKALEKAGAEKKITEFLDHIRKEYRNPISHPTDTLELDEALNLFGAALSAIGQTSKAVVDLEAKKKAVTLPAASSAAVSLASLAGPQTAKST